MIILLLILGLALIGLHRFFAYWGEQELKAQRQRWDRLMQANEKPWTPPNFSQKAAKGFDRQRRMS